MKFRYLDDGYYLEQGPGRRRSGRLGDPRRRHLLPGDLASEPLDKYKVMFCVNLPALDADAAERLRAYVAGGGNLVWICGDNVDPEAYNQMNEQAGGGLLPAPLLDVRVPARKPAATVGTSSFLDKLHPALGRLVEPPSLYESVLVYKHVRMAAGRAGPACWPGWTTASRCWSSGA